MILKFLKSLFLTLLKFGRPLTAQNVECLSLNNQPSLSRPTFFYSNPSELWQYPFVVSLDGCGRIYNTLEDLSSKLWVPSKTED